jgi:hypothetical protein
MGIARYLSNLASVLSTDGVVPAAKGGTGLASPGASGNLLVSDGTSWTSAAGLAGPTGPAGLGFTIAKTYSSVAALTADTSPTGIVAGQFALIDTGDINNAENSRLYVWNGTSYTYTSDLSGAQGIVGPTGPQGTNGTIGVDGAQGPTGPTGPAGTAPTGGATYYTGDIVISANSAQYTAPTWLPCDGAMYTPGTYPQLDALYQTAGDYATTPGLFTEPKYTDNSNITWSNTVNYASHSTLDPLTGDLIYYSYAYPAGSRVLYIQRASDGRFVYNPNNQLAADVVSDYGVGSSQGINFAISPNGQLMFVQRYSGGILATMYKRNSPAVEASTGIRWVRQASTTAFNMTVNYQSTSLSNDGIIIFNYASTSYFGWAKYDIPSNTFSPWSNVMYNGYTGATPSGSGGQKGWVWHPTLTSYAIVASSATATQIPSGMYAWNGGGFNLVSTSYNGTVTNPTGCAMNRAGTGAYFQRSSFIDIHAIDASNGNLTYQSSISVGSTIQSISFSQGDAFMAVATSNGIIMYQRTAPGALTYTATGYSPENYGNFGIPNGAWKVEFDPVYNTLVGFGSWSTTGSYTVQNWKGIAKTIVPATASPGKLLKHYIKTGS